MNVQRCCDAAKEAMGVPNSADGMRVPWAAVPAMVRWTGLSNVGSALSPMFHGHAFNWIHGPLPGWQHRRVYDLRSAKGLPRFRLYRQDTRSAILTSIWAIVPQLTHQRQALAGVGSLNRRRQCEVFLHEYPRMELLFRVVEGGHGVDAPDMSPLLPHTC